METMEDDEPTNWCFVSYVFYVQGSEKPRFGNFVIPMRGSIRSGSDFSILNKVVRDSIEEAIEPKGLKLDTEPVILNFKEL